MEFNFAELKDKIAGHSLEAKLQLVQLAYQLHQRKTLDHQQDQELSSMESQYLQKVHPYIKATNEIASGARAPTDEELTELSKYTKEGEQVDLTAGPVESYWLKAIQNSKTISRFMDKKDEPILQKLTGIENITNADNENFGMIFTFSANEYFTNDFIKIDFIIDEKTHEPKKIISTPILWAAGKNVTVKLVKKRKKKVTKVIEQEQQSFFNLFRNIDLDSLTDKKEEEITQIQGKLETAFDIAKLIHDEIVPYSLEYFLDVHVEDEEDFDEEDGLDDDDDDEDEEEITKEQAIQRMKARFGKK